ncbi:hypothetical protein ABT173_22960 [Streptomyces sp. NPDC001795]|uniref:hypothetical protein n=1 Tax=Streptomyces sp. NPDC001795 TaxID=3154525 RepID=UPI00331C8271
MLVVTVDGAEALCGQCETAVQGRPDAAVGPIGKTIKVEAAPPRELAPWEVIAKELADAIKDGTMLPARTSPRSATSRRPTVSRSVPRTEPSPS